MNRDDILNAAGERQISRRNEVCFVKCGDALCVRKKYLQPGASQTERDTLALLAQAGVAVPRVLYSDGEYTVLEHIPGMTYEGVLADYESGELREEELSDALGALTDWLVCWYAVTGKKRGDINLRNFIWTGMRCVGVDFEEETDGPPFEEDMGRMLTYAASYSPPYTGKKRRFCALLLERFAETGASPELIEKYALAEIDAMQSRRGEGFAETAPRAREFIRSLFSAAQEEADR